ncbi:MAG: hypothetical protein DCC65_05395 [Planctomycetota bacterium]|nr:MAG: hypothetical protein DCC65_05395 [Planctomycetota bacterium]
MNGVGKAIERLISDPGHELGRWARFLRFQINLWRFCARRLRENNVMAMSAALSFRTIFALIPFLVLALLSMKSLGVLEDARQTLRKFLDASGFAQIAVLAEHDDATTMPAEASTAPGGKVINVADEIEKIVAGVESKLTFQRIGPVGGFLLIWTALTLLTTVERSLNRIFEAPRSRSLARRILIYWSVTTLGPLLLAVTVFLGRQAVASIQGDSWFGLLLVVFGRLGPIVAGVLVLSMTFALLPNTQVRFRAAIGGAVIAVPLWLLAKWGFSFYVERLVVKGNLYGVLGALPLFLFWLNLSWLIFLFGAELAHTAANLEGMELAERAEKTVLGPSDVLAAAAAVASCHDSGEGPIALGEVAARLRLPADSVARLLQQLADAGIVCPVAGGRECRYALAKAPATVRVLDVLEVADPRLGSSAGASYGSDVIDAVVQAQSRTRAALADLTLADILVTPVSAAAPLRSIA